VGYIFNHHFLGKFTTESLTERILKIGQYSTNTVYGKLDISDTD